jgi:hypothetical protein
VFHELVSHNEDVRRLLERGYAIGFDSGYLVVQDIPYLDDQRRCRSGAIVTKLDHIDRTKINKPNDHQIFFAGSHPCNLDGMPIRNLGGGPAGLVLTKKNVVVERTFSNKPPEGFSNFFDKIESYVAIISGPAMELHGATPYTFRVDEAVGASEVFKFQDTLTSRAEIGDLAAKLKEDVVALVGLGGTGAYLLDFFVKSPVREVRGFDADAFHVHNAFRAPGRLLEDELGKPKAVVHAGRYENFRNGLLLEPCCVDATSEDLLKGVTFAFVCVDKGSSRARIFDLLITLKIPFIDVGMGLNRKQGPLNGLLRVTYYAPEIAEAMRAKGLAEMHDDPDDAYRNNIQISELNALNACLAIIRFKQLRGVYVDDNAYAHLLFGVGDLHLTGETAP